MIPTHPEKEEVDAGIFRLMEGRSQEENDSSSEPSRGCDRVPICFSKSTQMHDIVIGLFVNRYAFGRAV
jgi:hypothetical protein